MTQLLLVIGNSGQVARELARASIPIGMRLEALGHDRLDLTQPEAAAQTILALRPSLVINAGAYTAVDKAETNTDAAFLTNRDGPAAIASACARLGVPLVHISSDYVFDGLKPAPYVETDPKAPINVYGRSKSEGEDAILASRAEATILRTSWVYSSHGENFLLTMLRLAQTREEIGVVADQFGRPTWARDLALVALKVGLLSLSGKKSARGIFHYSGAGDAAWADFAEAIFAGARARGAPAARVRRIPSAEYTTTAKRPINSRLDTTKIENDLGIAPRPWREACELCLQELLDITR